VIDPIARVTLRRPASPAVSRLFRRLRVSPLRPRAFGALVRRQPA
jgi:hypothetical protein